jgi:hypothetical protein
MWKFDVKKTAGFSTVVLQCQEQLLDAVAFLLESKSNRDPEIQRSREFSRGDNGNAFGMHLQNIAIGLIESSESSIDASPFMSATVVPTHGPS